MISILCSNCATSNKNNARYCLSCGHALPKMEELAMEEKPMQQIIVNNPRKNKGIIGAIFGVFFFALAYWLVQQYFIVPSTFNKQMMAMASELNKTCPIMVDAETRLDNAIALPPDIFQYNYTLVNLDKEAVDTLGLKGFIEPTIINNVKTNPQMQYQRDHKITMNYYYKDKLGQYLFMVSVSPDRYEN